MITKGELARRLGVCTKTIERMIARDELPPPHVRHNTRNQRWWWAKVKGFIDPSQEGGVSQTVPKLSQTRALENAQEPMENPSCPLGSALIVSDATRAPKPSIKKRDAAQKLEAKLQRRASAATRRVKPLDPADRRNVLVRAERGAMARSPAKPTSTAQSCRRP